MPRLPRAVRAVKLAARGALLGCLGGVIGGCFGGGLAGFVVMAYHFVAEGSAIKGVFAGIASGFSFGLLSMLPGAKCGLLVGALASPCTRNRWLGTVLGGSAGGAIAVVQRYTNHVPPGRVEFEAIFISIFAATAAGATGAVAAIDNRAPARGAR